MLGLITTSLFVLALLSLVTAGIAIGWLVKLRKNLSVLGQRVLESEDIGKILQAAEKVGLYESRITGCQSKADECKKQIDEHETKLNQLVQLETKVNEHAARLQSVEKIAGRNEVDLAKADQNIKALTDEIEILQKFQTATEKTHSLIQAAFTDMGAGMSSDESREVKPQIEEPQESSHASENEYGEAEYHKMSDTYNLEI
jgi:septal ring factor EnvC (AmiA/AmiB activator)